MSNVAVLRQVEAGPADLAGGASPERLTTLIERAIAGEPGAVHDLILVVAPIVRRCCKSILGAGHADLEDAIQDSLMAFVRALSNYRFECQVTHYAVRIAFRTAHTRRRRLLSWRDRFRLSDELDDEIHHADGPSERAISDQRSEALRRVIAKLPPEQAEALTLRIALEYSMTEVAMIVGVPLNTIKTRMRLGKEALRRHIEREPVLRAVFGGQP
jgi:RNA polymerase sigma-70 factor (ECF subfamily)